MIANETKVATDGYEVMLFPLEYLYMTQDEGGDFSHAGTYNIDFVGYSSSGVVYRCPLYAPCSLKIKSVLTDGSNGLILESLDKVHLPNGSLDYITLSTGHDNDPPSKTVGHIFRQGELFYHTGTAGYATGDHVHLCVGQGLGGVLIQRPTGNWDLSNRIHMWDGMYVDDTTIIQGYGHPWLVYGETPPPTPPTPPKLKTRGRSYPWPVALSAWGFNRKKF